MANTLTISKWIDTGSNVPALLISVSGDAATLNILDWNGSAPKGGNIQLYARQVVNGVGGHYQTSGWDGVDEIVNQGGWKVGPKTKIWPVPDPNTGFNMTSFPLNNSTAWSILPQYGAVGSSTPNSTSMEVSPITSVPYGGMLPTTVQVTLSNVVIDNNGGTGNVIVTVEIDAEVP